MPGGKRAMILINILGGSAVLGSYAYALSSSSVPAGAFWGGVPDALRPVYGSSMLLAAAGYFAFSYFVVFRLDPAETRIGGRFGYTALNGLYALILLPSALWMPLTAAMLESPSTGLWWVICGTLAAVGVGSLGLLAALLTIRSPRAPGARWAAVIGCTAFCFQTAILDALVWPAYFPA